MKLMNRKQQHKPIFTEMLFTTLIKAHFTQTLAVITADESLVFHTRGPWKKALGDIFLGLFFLCVVMVLHKIQSCGVQNEILGISVCEQFKK